MKKITSILVSIVMVLSLAVPAFAGSVGTDYGTIPKSPVDITIDGIKDPVYDYALKLDIASYSDGDVDLGTRGKAYLLWRGTDMFVFIEVVDPEVVIRSHDVQLSQPWKTDCATFYIDPTNLADADHLDDVMQYRLDCTGWPSVYSPRAAGTLEAYGSAEDGFTQNADGLYAADFFDFAGMFSTESYQVEYRIPICDQPYVGQAVAFLLTVSDRYNNGDDSTQARLEEFAYSGYGVWDAEAWPFAVLADVPADYAEDVDEPAVVEPEVPAEDPVDEPLIIAPAPVVDDNPQTSDANWLAVVVATVSLFAVVFVSKKRTCKE